MLIAAALSCVLPAQGQTREDSVAYTAGIEPVTVMATPLQPGVLSVVSKGLQARSLQFEPVGNSVDLLAKLPGVSLRRYGSGGIVSLRYLGQSSAQLRMEWAGLEVSDPQLGGTALDVLVGANTQLAFEQTGSAGTSLNLAARPVTALHINTQLSVGAGYRLGVSAPTRLGEIAVTGIHDQFDFDHSESVSGAPARLKHGAMTLHRRDTVLASWEMTTDVFLQATERTLPLTAFERDQAPAELASREGRFSLSLRRTHNDFHPSRQAKPVRVPLTARVGMLYADRNYRDPFRSLLSEGQTVQAIGQVAFSLTPQLEVSSEGRLVNSTHNAYSRQASFFRSEHSLGHATHLGSLPVLAKAYLMTHGLSTPEWAASLELPELSSLPWLKASLLLQRTARYPLLDDLLWREGGSATIQAETAWAATAKLELADHWGLKLFGRQVHDYLLWLPGQPFWTPQNLERVSIYGASVHGKREIELHSAKLELLGHLTYTHSNTEFLPSGSLPFLPNWTGGLNAAVLAGSWQANLTSTYSSTQLTTFADDVALPAYAQLDLSVRYQYAKLSVGVSATNVTNTKIPNADRYPTPLRRAHLNLTYQL